LEISCVCCISANNEKRQTFNFEAGHLLVTGIPLHRITVVIIYAKRLSSAIDLSIRPQDQLAWFETKKSFFALETRFPFSSWALYIPSSSIKSIRLVLLGMKRHLFFFCTGLPRRRIWNHNDKQILASVGKVEWNTARR
jgi:hypothetical protein